VAVTKQVPVVAAPTAVAVNWLPESEQVALVPLATEKDTAPALPPVVAEVKAVPKLPLKLVIVKVD